MRLLNAFHQHFLKTSILLVTPISSPFWAVNLVFWVITSLYCTQITKTAVQFISQWVPTYTKMFLTVSMTVLIGVTCECLHVLFCSISTLSWNTWSTRTSIGEPHPCLMTSHWMKKILDSLFCLLKTYFLLSHIQLEKYDTRKYCNTMSSSHRLDWEEQIKLLLYLFQGLIQAPNIASVDNLAQIIHTATPHKADSLFVLIPSHLNPLSNDRILNHWDF